MSRTEGPRFRQMAGIVAGVGTAGAVYAAEGYALYKGAEIIVTGFQDPESIVFGIIAAIAIFIAVATDLSKNHGQVTSKVLLFGSLIGYGVYKIIAGD